MGLFSKKVLKAFISKEDFDKINAKYFKLKEGCKKHPTYRYHKEPKVKCETCKELYDLNKTLNMIQLYYFNIPQ